ncbi:MAG: glucose-6-phosphate isomerase, partial [Sphaerospermopsis kisseleviana]
AYHQPGVEAGKKAAAAILDLQQKVIKVLQTEKKALSIAEIADTAGAAEQVEAIYKILRHLHANNRGVLLTGDLSKPGTLTVSLG